MADSPTSLTEKSATLHRLLREMGSVAVAFSAGVDSTFLLKAAVESLGIEHVLAVTADSPSVPRQELEESKALAEAMGARHEFVSTREFEDANYLANPTNRCYFCKTSLYDHMMHVVRERGIPWIVNGVNADDLGDFRPGIEAGRERNVRSPLAEAGLTKDDIRALSARAGLPTHDKPASPCLSSRVQYGESITPEKLAMIEKAEAYLHELGIRECRVRHHDNLARIEVPLEFIPRLAGADLSRAIDDYFRELGYKYVSLDLRGFRTGSMNEVIAFGKLQSLV